MTRPEFAPEQEVRFAVVMYGGISLAIYINGVVQELFRLVRATAPEFEGADQPLGKLAYFDTDSLKGTETVYRELGQVLAVAREAEPVGGKDAPIRTRFVVDILSGSSAGGINAIFLAKAIANQQSIDGLRDLWIEEADISDLLNDRQSYRDIQHLERQNPPRSLLNGGRLYVRAWEALRAMAKSQERREDNFSPAYAEELDLAVTTTDLQGLRLPIQLYDRVVYESRHKNVLRFGYATARATGEARNDFGPESDELLAFAARCTSAFPFAFEPAVPRDMPRRDGPPAFEDWNPFFPEYVARRADWPGYAFADGGYLDNKPFSYATEALRRRRADIPVQRKLLYIEPDPTGEPLAPDEPPLGAEAPEPAPDVLDNLIAATSLPRVETIREDIQAVVDRNRTVRRIRRLTLELGETVLSGQDPLDGVHDLPPDADDGAVREACDCPQLTYTSYVRLRVEMVVDDLASAFVRLAGGREDSDEVEAARILIHRMVAVEWRDRRRAFLMAYDVRFRLRRLAFVQDRINELLRGEDERSAARVAHEEDLPGIKRELNNAFVELRRRARSARSRTADEGDGDRPQDDAELEQFARLREIVSGSPLDEGVMTRVLGAGGEEEVPPAPEFEAALTELLDIAGGHLAPALHDADSRVPALLQQTAPSVAEYYARFESFDMVMLPLTYPGLEEVNPVDVVRIAPEDATGLISEGKEPRKRKLAGTSLGHFGGFMDVGWRRNDLMWGRLDGAERILQALLPEGEQRDRLRNQAHAAIIREELVEQDAGPLTDLLAGALGADESGARALLETLHDEDAPAEGRAALTAGLSELPDAALLAQFRENYEVPRRLDPQRATGVAGRAAALGGQLLGEASKKRSGPAKPGFWLSRVGRVVWSVAEVAIPGGRKIRLPVLLFRHWTLVAVLLGVLLILAGALGVEAAQRVGWILLIATLVLRVVVWLAGAAMTEAPVAGAVDAPPSAGGVGGWLRRHWPWLVALLGIALGVAGIWIDLLQPIGWVILGLGVLVILLRWALVAPYQRRLRLAALAALVTALTLAGLELGRHLGDDISAATAAALPGDGDSGVEGSVRDAWKWSEKVFWPWT